MATKIKIDVELAKRAITAKEALDLLSIFIDKRKKRVHTLQQALWGRMGCNVDLTPIKKRLMASKEIYISNVMPLHDIVFREADGSLLWLETDEYKINEIKKKRKLTF